MKLYISLSIQRMKLKVISEWSDKGKESGIRPFNLLVFRKIYYRVKAPELCSVQFQYCFKQEIARNILLSKNWQLNKTQVCVLSLYIFYPEVSYDFMVFSHSVSLFLSVAHNLWYHFFFFNCLEWEHKAIGSEDTEPGAAWKKGLLLPPEALQRQRVWRQICCAGGGMMGTPQPGSVPAATAVCVPAGSPRCPWGAAVEVGGDVHCSKTNRIH